MTDLQIFNYGSRQIRTVVLNGEPWWVAKDVCDTLDIQNPTMSLKNLEPDEVTKYNLGGLSGDSNIINESGLYSLILQSRKPEAKKFKKWITSEVLPSIRKTGQYSLPKSDDEIILIGYEKLMQKVMALTPKADAYDKFLSSEEAVDMAVVAKTLFGAKMGRNSLFKKLRDAGILLSNNTPDQKYMKYFKVIHVPKPIGDQVVTFPTTLVKPEGIDYIAKTFNVISLPEQEVKSYKV